MAINVRADIEASQKKKKKIDVKADIARTAAPKVTTSKKDKSYTGVDAEINRREASRSARYSMQPEVRAGAIKRAEAAGDTDRVRELTRATDVEAWAKKQTESDFVRARAQNVYDDEFARASARGDQNPAISADKAANAYLDLYRGAAAKTREATYKYRQDEKRAEFETVNNLPNFEQRVRMGAAIVPSKRKKKSEAILAYINDPTVITKDREIAGRYGESLPILDHVSVMTEDEKNRIRFFASHGQYDKIEEYYNLIERDLNARLQENRNKQTYEEAYSNPIKGAVQNVGASFVTPAAYVANAANTVANVFRDEYVPTDTNTEAFSGAHTERETSRGVTERARDAAGGGVAGEFASLAAGTGLSMANFISKAPLGPTGAMIAMGADVAGQTTLDVLERGGTSGQALFLSTAAGAIEALTEKLPLDNLFRTAKEVGKTGLKTTIKSVLKQAGMEATEEMVSELANTALDIAVMREKSEYQQYISELEKNGMSRAEAEKEAFFQYFGKNILMAGAGGALSGGIMGGGATAISGINTAIQNRNAGAAEGEAGFTKNEYSEKISNKTIRALDSIGKKLGVNIQIGAPTGTEAGAYNGYYKNGTIVIAQDAENPLEVVLSHEVTHHMKTAAPAEYAKFAELAINASTKLEGTAKADLISRYRQSYAEGTQTDFTEDAAIDEITADYASKLVNDVETFRELVRADKTVAERFIESIKEFIAKVKTTFSKDKTKADTASLEKYGATVSELEAAVKTYEDMIKTTQTAVTSGQFGIENTAENPTSNPDIHFSLKEPVEETKRLVALHNLSAEKLLKALKMGGFPMPSIAVTRANGEYSNFGDISLIMSKSTVDPKANRNNAVYSADAWTPTYPRVDYEVNPEAETRLSKKYYDLAGRFGRDAVQALYSYGNTLEETLNRSGGAEGIISRLKDDTKMMNVYLLDVGKSQVEDVYKETTTRLSDAEIEEYDFIVNGLGKDVLNETYPADGESPMTTRKKWIEAHGEKLVKVYEEYLSSVGLSEEEVANVMRNSDYDAKRLLRDVVIPARNYLKNGAEKTTREYDGAATAEAIRNAVDTKAYESWLQENFGDIELGQGIYNGKDYFTPSGQRRSFAALHYAHTLENVVKAMMEKGRKGLGGFGGGNIFGASAVEYDSIEAMRDDAKKRLTNLPQEEYDAIREGFSDRFFEIASSLPKNKESFHAVDDAANMLIEAVLKYKTKSGMANYLRKESEGWANYYDYIVDDLIELVDDIRQMPVGYFEAKPERAVGFDEVLAAVLPSDTSEEIKAQLKETGIEVLTYEKGNAEDRKAKVNSVNNAQFSLKKRKPNEASGGTEKAAASNDLETYKSILDVARGEDFETVSQLMKRFKRGSEEWKILKDLKKKGYGKRNAYNLIRALKEEQVDAEESSTFSDSQQISGTINPVSSEDTEPAKVEPVAEVETEIANAEEPEPVVEEPLKVSEPEPAPEEIPEATPAEDEKSYIRDTGLDAYFEDLGERAQVIQDKRIRDAERVLMSTPERQKKTMREKVKESRDFLKRKIENSGAALRDIAKKTKDKSLYPIYNRARGAMNIVSDMITNKQTNIRGEKVGESLEGIIARIKEKGDEYFRDFQLYLLHKHNVARMSLRDTKAEEIAKTDLEIFIRDNPGIAAMGETALKRASQWDDVKGIKAKQYIELRERLNRLQNTKNKPIFFDNDEVPLSAAESRRAAEELLEKKPEFTEDEAKIRTYLDNLMQYRVDTGLITQQEADYFKKKYPDYIPTYRDTESVQKQLQGKLNIGKTVGKARGGNDPILPLDVALAEMTKKVVRSGQKNIFANKVFSLYDKHSKLLERYITDVQEGKVDIDAEIDGFGEERADDNTVTFHNDGKRIELTVTPELYEAFAEMSKILKEQAPVADWWRKINNGYKKLITTYDPTFIIRNGIKDLQDAIINSRDTKAMLKNLPKAYVEIANGGELFELYRSMGGLHSSRFEEIKTKGVEKKSWAKKLPDALAFGNMMVEQAPRLAEFMSVLEKGDRNDLDVLADALYAAADVTTNFGESGTWGKVLNAYYVPFLNPAIQGTAKIGRLITEPKTAKQWYGLAAKAVIMGVGAGFINDILIGMFGDDEEKEAYENLQDRVKDNYFLIPTDDGKFAKIPKGRIAASLGVIADRVRDVAKGEKVSAGEAIVRVLENIAPENPITNNIASPLIEADLFNNESKGRTWYGGDIESDSLQGLPAGERFDSSTDYISKYVGKAVGLSPKKINYILKQYTGGAGRTILPMITPSEQKGDTIAGVIGYGALSILTSNFMVDSKLSNKVSGEFYDMVSEAEQKKNSSKGTLADKVVYKHLNRERNQMSGYNKKIREAETDSSLTSKERDVAVRAATASRTEYQKEVIDNLDQYRANVEKYLKEYPGKDEENKIEYAYRKANYATYGAEYAIRVNGGKSVYEKAAEKVKRGKTTWEEYYEEYFGRDKRRYEILRDKYDISYAEYEKIANAMSKNSTEEEEIEALHKLGYKRSTARGIRRNFNKVK